MPRKYRFEPEGFSAVRAENVNQVANLRADLIAVYQPVNSQELFAIERVALAQHSLLRSYRLEAGFITCALEEGLELPANPRILRVPELTKGPVTKGQNHNYWMAFGLSRLNRNSTDWPMLLRYQTHAERLYRRAIEELERLRALRGVLPEQDITDPEPEPEPVVVQPAEVQPDTQPEPETGTPAACHKRRGHRAHSVRTGQKSTVPLKAVSYPRSSALIYGPASSSFSVP